ncbi:hypothetical protein FRC03_008491 [Tulasnella sp. 419]|nr:hypothetical protein FRC02_012404 [Tulasnella sp. 418]KAG8968138.1 hypothetical protein FRC03_008491 [Tulasnella sp. 419]
MSSSSDEVLSLEDIWLLRSFYKFGFMAEPSEDQQRFPPNIGLLETVSYIQHDITKLKVDAIVNAANNSLLGGGGVDGAIHRAAGRELLQECRSLNGCKTGEAKITKGYKLPSSYVIHTVGPIYHTGPREEVKKLLESCYRTCLNLAVQDGLKSIAFPAISTGAYGYPIREAAHVALRTVREFLETDDGSKLDRVIFVLHTKSDFLVYSELLPQYFPL